MTAITVMASEEPGSELAGIVATEDKLRRAS
jgi:hypothetical protein